MTNQEAIKTLEIAKAEIEWTYPMDYQIAFDMAIEALRSCDGCIFVDDTKGPCWYCSRNRRNLKDMYVGEENV